MKYRNASLPTITIDLDKKCAECGKGGAADNGICLSCMTKAIKGNPMRSTVGKAAQQRFQAVVAKVRGEHS